MVDLFSPPTDAEIVHRTLKRQAVCRHKWYEGGENHHYFPLSYMKIPTTIPVLELNLVNYRVCAKCGLTESNDRPIRSAYRRRDL